MRGTLSDPINQPSFPTSNKAVGKRLFTFKAALKYNFHSFDVTGREW